MSKVLYYFGILMIFCLGLCCDSKSLEFEMYEAECGYKTYSDGSKSNYSETYIVSGYEVDIESETSIDNFACEKANILLKDKNKVSISFYKKSDKTNLEYLQEHPNYFHEGNFLEEDRGSLFNDFLWVYSFNKEKGTVKKRKPKNHSGYKFFNTPLDCLD